MQVLYTDGDEEILILKRQKFELIGDDSESDKVSHYLSCLLDFLDVVLIHLIDRKKQQITQVLRPLLKRMCSFLLCISLSIDNCITF